MATTCDLQKSPNTTLPLFSIGQDVLSKECKTQITRTDHMCCDGGLVVAGVPKQVSLIHLSTEQALNSVGTGYSAVAIPRACLMDPRP